MKLYFASVYVSSVGLHSTIYRRMDDVEKADRAAIKNILEPYVYEKKFTKDIKRDGVKIFLDSGAFTAHMLGTEISLNDFCHYIRTNSANLEMYSVLDAIGDPARTRQNQQAMESDGTAPLPCFHYGEDEGFLKWYLGKYAYISLGGLVPISKPQQHAWLDYIWSRYLTHKDGSPRYKVHGFGINTYSTMMRYPWHSVDATTWMHWGSNGAIALFLNDRLYNFPISHHASAAKRSFAHYDTLPAAYRNCVLEIIQRRGYSLERLQRQYLSRWAFNMGTFQQVADYLDSLDRPFINQKIELFT